MAFDAAPVRAILFDVDGTLRDTDDELVERVARMLERLPHGGRAGAWSRRAVMAAESPVQHLLSYADRVHLDGHLMRLVERATPGGHGPTRLIDGIAGAVDALGDRYVLGVVSAGPRGMVAHFLEEHGLASRLPVVITGQSCRRTKPHPEPVLAALARLGAAPSAGVMVGDTTVDVRAGRAAGVQTVGVLSGFGGRRELEAAGADLILASVADLPDALAAASRRPG